MAKFTATLGEICEGLYGAEEPIGGSSIEVVISTVRGQVFNTPYPFYTEDQKQRLEQNIIRHYWNREIGYETFGLWRVKLAARLNEIMPAYVKMYEVEDAITDPLGNTNYHEITSTDENGNNTGKDTTNSNANSSNTEMYSDTPQGGLSGVKGGNYLTNATVNDNSGTSNETRNSENAYNKDVQFSRRVTGKMGGESNGKALIEYRESLINIDKLIIAELADLFMGIWEPASGLR